MNPPTLPASPWQASPLPDSRAIVTGDGYFLLDLEGLDMPPQTAQNLKRAVAALPTLLLHLDHLKAAADSPEVSDKGFRSFAYHQARELLTIAGYTATVPQPHDQKPD